MKQTRIARRYRRSESVVHQETVVNAVVQCRYTRMASAYCQGEVYFQSDVSDVASEPPSRSEIDPGAGPMGKTPRLSGDRAEERGA